MTQAEHQVKCLQEQLTAAEERLRAQGEAHKSEVAASRAKALEAETKATQAEDKVKRLSERWREERNCLVEQVHCMHVFTTCFDRSLYRLSSWSKKYWFVHFMQTTTMQESLKEKELELMEMKRKTTQLEQRMLAKPHHTSHQPLAQTHPVLTTYSRLCMREVRATVIVGARDRIQGMSRLLLRQSINIVLLTLVL